MSAEADRRSPAAAAVAHANTSEVEPDTAVKDYARAAALALAAFDAAAFSAFFADLTAIFAAPLACLASVAKAAGLAIASSDRLLRSSVTPACLQPVDQLAVGEAVLARGGVDADHPQAAEVALLAAAADEGVFERGVDRLFRGTIQLALVGVIALRQPKQLLPLGARGPFLVLHAAFFYLHGYGSGSRLGKPRYA